MEGIVLVEDSIEIQGGAKSASPYEREWFVLSNIAIHSKDRYD